MDSKLATAIDELVEKRTFTLDGLEAIKSLRTRAANLDAMIEERNRAVTSRDETIAGLREQISTITAQLSALRQREADVAAREAKMNQVEQDAAVARARATTMEAVFGTIFKNVTVRENTLNSISRQVVQPGGYTMTVPENSSVTVERTTE